jgi:hypothetical protein
VERDMVDGGGSEGVHLSLAGHEELPLPFCFITVNAAQVGRKAPPASLSASATSGGEESKAAAAPPSWQEAVRTIEVTVVSGSHGNVVAMLVVEVRVQPLAVDRVLRFYQAEGQILRRCVRFYSPPNMALEEDQDSTKYVHCLEVGQNQRKSVVVEWRQADGYTVGAVRPLMTCPRPG